MTPTLAAVPLLLAFSSLLAGCAAGPRDGIPAIEPDRGSDLAVGGALRPPFKFAAEDDALLDEITRGAFNSLWKPVNATGMVPDRTSQPRLVSVAGVGFQLSAFCIGVERGWVTRTEASERALRIVRALESQTSNRRFGMFYHFIDGDTGGFPSGTPEDGVSTVDSALLFAGLLTAGEYFGGEVAALADKLYAGADWNAFILKDGVAEYERGVISLAWAPDDPKHPEGPGKLKPYGWVDAGDEHRLVTFLAVASPDPAHRVDAPVYYRLRRPLGEFEGQRMVFLPWSGAHFVNLFAHCWINYAAMPADEPGKFGYPTRSRVDWWENSRRQTVLQRSKAIAASARFPNLGPDSWGLTASDCPAGYCVPGLYPTPIFPAGQRRQWDAPDFQPKEDYADGTVSPYAAVGSVMFLPREAVSAARFMRGLKRPDGAPMLWREPKTGGFGLVDAYNRTAGAGGWVAADDLAIDQGPMALLVENARTGLISRLFHGHRWVAAGAARVGWPAELGKRRAPAGQKDNRDR